MTVLETGPTRQLAVDVAAARMAEGAADVTITDTTELRCFVEGSLPSEVAASFTHSGTRGFLEQRCDSYRMDGRIDIGVKRRSGETLELKVRRGIDEPITFAPGLVGRLEIWRRWSPAFGLGTGSANVNWVDVHKTIVKRRFTVDGDEVALSMDDRAMTGAGCDVEIADVTVNGIGAWTFALAAFGPIEDRRHSMMASMHALVRNGAHLGRFVPLFGVSSGYPEWLALVASRSAAGSACDLHRR